MTTTEEAIALLKQSGFSVTPPKTREEELQEALDRRLQEQAERFEAQQATLLAKIEEMGKQVTEASNPFARAQRKSLVEATAQEPSHRPYYRNGDYIREHLNDQSFREGLLDRSRPLPDNINPEHLLRELQLELLGMYDATYGLTGNPRIVAL